MWSYDCILQVHKNANLRFMYAWLLHSLFHSLSTCLLTLLDVFVLLLHLFAHCSGQSLHYGAHDVEVSHIVHMRVVWL